MDGFNYAIASILGAMLVVIGMDAYLFFTEVMSRQWRNFCLVYKAIFPVLAGCYQRFGSGSWNPHQTSASGSGIQIGMITFGMQNESMDALPCWRGPSFLSGA